MLPTTTDKKLLRQIVLSQRKNLTSDAVKLYSEQIAKRIEISTEFIEAHTVLVYYPIQNEIDITLLLDKWEQKKQFLLPVVRGQEMEMHIYEGKEKLVLGQFGIPEPTTPKFIETPDLIIVPGVVFDTKRNRIGRGKGFYDRFLAKYNTEIWGVCYDFQLYERISTTPLDIKMSKVITPTQLIEV